MGAIDRLADTIDRRYCALVLLASFASIRWGELAALRRSDIGLHARTVRINRTLIETQNGALSYGPPKSDAGKRVVICTPQTNASGPSPILSAPPPAQD